MSWAKLDDRFHSNPKVSRVWHTCPSAIGLYVMSITHCAQHETDGRIDEYFIVGLVPYQMGRTLIVEALLDAGLWTRIEAGAYEIPDYLDFNPSHAEQEKRRKTDRARQAKGRKSQAQTRDSVRVLSERSPSGVRAESERGKPNLSERPDPTRPDPLEGSYASEGSFLESAGGSYLGNETIEASRGMAG